MAGATVQGWGGVQKQNRRRRSDGRNFSRRPHDTVRRDAGTGTPGADPCSAPGPFVALRNFRGGEHRGDTAHVVARPGNLLAGEKCVPQVRAPRRGGVRIFCRVPIRVFVLQTCRADDAAAFFA